MPPKLGRVGDTRERAVVAGASGFIGQTLFRDLRDLREQGYQVVSIGRTWPDLAPAIDDVVRRTGRP